MDESPTPARFSLRHLLALVAAVAVALAALKFAGDVWWTVLSTAALVVFLAAAVIAFMERGGRQAAAIGFVVCAGIYGTLLFVVQLWHDGRSGEFDPYEGILPTTKIMFPVFQATVTNTWTDSATGEIIPDFDPANPGPYNVSGSFFSGQQYAKHQEIPYRTDFMRVAHLLWAVLFGFVGGWFAGFVYRRRVAREGAT